MTENPPNVSAATAEITTDMEAESEGKAVTTSNGVSACAGTGVGLDTVDVKRERYSLRSFTFGLWELNAAESGSGSSEGSRGSTQPPQQLALPPPPLPALPPVGPARRRSRSQSLTRAPSLPPSFAAHSGACTPSGSHPYGGLQRSQSMADVFTAMVAARLKPAAAGPVFARSTHCQECNQRFSLIFRRHHCRMCQRSVCAYCSTYQRLACDLAEETESEVKEEESGGASSGAFSGLEGDRGDADDVIEVKGKGQMSSSSLTKTVLHRVCRKCASEMEVKKTGPHRTWTDEFVNLRQIFKDGRQTKPGVLGETHLLPPKIPRMPKVCEPIAASFLEECRRNSVRHRSRFLVASASFNSGLQYALKPRTAEMSAGGPQEIKKPPDQKLCNTCGKLLRFPVERKTCALCEEIFCRVCSSRDLALSLPDDLDPGDIGHEIAQVSARVLTKQEAEEMDRTSAPPTGVSPGTCVQRYRVCHDCREHVQHVMKVIAFNDTLTHLQAELMDLQEQIAAVLDDQDNPSPGIGMTRWPSVRSVHTYTCVEDEIVGEAVNYRVAEKLLERYFRVFLQLERLSSETVTQGVLIKHVKQAMSAFYMKRRSVAAKRFNGREAIVTLPSAPHYL